MSSRSSWPFLLLPLVATPLAAQVPSRTLASPVEFAESFDQISSLRELSNGKLLLVDLGPKTVQLVDFGSGQVTTIGRNGQGPGEYQFPGELIPYLGDTTLVVDRVGRRLLPVTNDGKMGKVVSFPDAVAGIGDPRGADREGRVYFQANPFTFGGGQAISSQMPESTVILRWNRATTKVDTVARVKLPPTKMNVSSTGNSRAIMIRPQPYAGQDEWSVGRDGRIGILRVGDYHLDWLGDRPAHGAPVKFEPVKIGKAEREAFMERSRDTRGRFTVNSGGPGRGPAPKPDEPKEDDFDWPEVKPPFVPRNLFLAPEGVVWVQRSTPEQDAVPTYDLFDARGNLASSVLLPKGRRLVGLGTGTAYAVRTDDDGLQWLERYKR